MIEERYKLIHGDCLQEMRNLADNSVDLCLTDPPYGTTACKWDSVIPFEPMWKELKRIVKPKGAICLFGSQPFTSALVMSNPKDFRYEWTWDKKAVSNFLNAHKQPLRRLESIVVFYREQGMYNPQFGSDKPYIRLERSKASDNFGAQKVNSTINDGRRFPTNLLEFSNAVRGVHPTQKPVELLRYLIRTYTQENETVLDFTMGSGSTGVACMHENRKFIGIEKEANYFEITENRIKSAINSQPLFATV